MSMNQLGWSWMGTYLSLLGVVTAWQEHLEWGVKIGAGVVSIGVGLVTIIATVKKLRQKT